MQLRVRVQAHKRAEVQAQELRAESLWAMVRAAALLRAAEHPAVWLQAQELQAEVLRA
ncbi:MAG: hypothetical protein SGPRY_011506, partial [Prymnesium sp.]